MKKISVGILAILSTAYLAQSQVAIGQTAIQAENVALASLENVELPLQMKWQITRLGSKKNCFLQQSNSAEKGMVELQDAKTCNAVHESLTTATTFTEDALGNLVITDEENNRLFEFASAEFEGYESVYPEYPLLTLEPVK